MPRRTNEFQRFVYRVERLLQDHDAVVEESALVRNQATGERDEVDILISFKSGQRMYFTGVAVQERSRDKGDKERIRHLASQREECEIDRMVAVHSKGFTKSTRALAARKNIELIHPESVSEAALLSSIEPPVDGVLVTRTRWLEFGVRTHSPIPSRPEDISDVSIPGIGCIPSEDFRLIIDEQIRNFVFDTSRFDFTTPSSKDVKATFEAPLKFGSSVYIDGLIVDAMSVTGAILFSTGIAQMDHVELWNYGDRNIISGKDSRSPQDAAFTMAAISDGKYRVQAELAVGESATPRHINLGTVRIDRISE